MAQAGLELPFSCLSLSDARIPAAGLGIPHDFVPQSKEAPGVQFLWLATVSLTFYI